MEQNLKLAERQENILDTENELPEEKTKKVDCSHRVIEKRRRDRINNSLQQLSKLVPIEKFNKKNSGKLEKAEILEHTVQYLAELQCAKENETTTKIENDSNENEVDTKVNGSTKNQLPAFLRGFKQCIDDATKFFQDIEELDVSEGRCYRLIQHLKKQNSRYENQNGELTKVNFEDRVVWDAGESSDASNERSSSEDSNPGKRKNGDLDNALCKKQRVSLPGSSDGDTPTSEQGRSSGGSSTSSTTSESSTNMDPNFLRNFTPFFLPNAPLFTPMPFGGANNMPRFQSSQFPGYQYQQSPQYIPVALPQFPLMSPMNFVPGFGMVNGEQSQSNGLPTSCASAMPMHSGVTNNSMPGLLPNGLPNGFFPSMYTNGLHANILAMRTSDSGYDSEKSLSSKASAGSETSSQTFSEESCQSYVP